MLLLENIPSSTPIKKPNDIPDGNCNGIMNHSDCPTGYPVMWIKRKLNEGDNLGYGNLNREQDFLIWLSRFYPVKPHRAISARSMNSPALFPQYQRILAPVDLSSAMKRYPVDGGREQGSMG